MKKLIVLLMLLGLVTTVNAQMVNSDKDFITAQVIQSVSSLKSNSEKANAWNINEPVFLAQEESGLNPFEYIRQQADFISIAFTVYLHGGNEVITVRKEDDSETDYFPGSNAAVMYGGSAENDCFKHKLSHIK